MSSTDTNQASEDDLRESIDTLLERWRNILTHKGDGNGDEYYQSEVVDDIQEIIRTEKLKLLAEVSERVVGEDEDTQKWEDPIDRQVADECNQLRAEMRTILTKLEAEL